MATLFGDVTGLQQRYHLWNIPHLVEKIKGFPLKVKSFRNNATFTKTLPLYHCGVMTNLIRPRVNPTKKDKGRKHSLAYFIGKHPHESAESICCKNRPFLVLRFFSSSCQVMSCTFSPVLIEQFKVMLESFGVTVFVRDVNWHFCDCEQEALILQSGLLLGDILFG